MRHATVAGFIAVTVLCLAFPLPSSAEIPVTLAAVVPMAVEELVARADHVVIGTVRAVQSRRNPAGTSIVTDVSVAALEYFKSPTFQPEFRLTLPGGTVDGLTVKVEDVPAFTVHETVLVFLKDRPGQFSEIVGMGQGVYYLRGTRAIQAQSGQAVPVSDLKARLRSLVGVPPPAYGGALVLAKSTEELAWEADSIVVAWVEDVETRFTSTLESLERGVTLRLEQTLKGTPASRMTLVLPGGELGGLHVMVGGAPNFWPGERVLVFLRHTSAGLGIAGAWQGKMSVVNDVAIQAETGRGIPLSSMASRIAHALASPGIVRDDEVPTVVDAPFQVIPVPCAWTTAQVPVPHFVNPAFGGIGAPTGTAFVKLVQQSLQAWQNIPNAWFSARIAGMTTRPATNSFDGFNDVAWGNLDSIGSGVLGVNACSHDGVTRFDSDTRFDNTGLVWSTNAAPGTFDLDSVARHEFGHGLGLDHTQVFCNGGSTTPLMCPSFSPGMEKTILADDTSGLVSLYPLSGVPPAAPSGLGATQATETSVTLAWSNVVGELGYEVQRASGGCGGAFQAINSVPANSPAYLDDDLGGGLAPGPYCYRVKALGQGGDSGFSNTALIPVIVVFKGGVFVATGNVDGGAGAEIVTGPGQGGAPQVKVFTPSGTPVGPGYFPFPAGFLGGVRVAACDFDGDGLADIVAGAGPGGGPHVMVTKLDTAGNVVAHLASFFAYSAAFAGGVFVACGDVDGDGVPEVITAPDAGGGPHVRVLRLQAGTATPIFEFFAYDPSFTGGVRVAAGNVDGSDRASVITAAGPGGGPHVRALKLLTSGGAVVGTTDLASFFAYSPAFTGGVFVATGNVLGDGVARIITGAGAGGGPHVRVFTGTGADAGIGFFAYSAGFTGGVRVAAGNLDAAGADEIVTAPGSPGGPHVVGFTGAGAPTGTSFFAY